MSKRVFKNNDGTYRDIVGAEVSRLKIQAPDRVGLFVSELAFKFALSNAIRAYKMGIWKSEFIGEVARKDIALMNSLETKFDYPCYDPFDCVVRTLRLFYPDFFEANKHLKLGELIEKVEKELLIDEDQYSLDD